MAAVGLGVAPLPTEALDVEDGEAKHLHLGERLFDALEFAGLDDCDDEFHKAALEGNQREKSAG